MTVVENETEFLTTEQAAALLQIEPPALLSLRHRGAAPRAFRVGKSLRWPRAEVDAWIADRLTARPA